MLAHRCDNQRSANHNKQPRERVLFPEEPVMSRDVYYGRSWPARNLLVEPNYVCYGRLLFEQPNFERYGWDLGPASVALSTGKFFLRIEFSTSDESPSEDGFKKHFHDKVGHRFDMHWNLYDKSRKPRLLIMVSRYGHCLNLLKAMDR